MSGGIFGSGMGMNPLMATLSPDQQQNLIQLQQKQALGQALLQQGMEPLPAPNATAGGMAYRQSPLNGIANLAKTYLGAKMSMGAAGQEAQLMGQMYGNAFGVTPGAGGSASAASSGQPDDSGASASDSIPGTGGIGAGMTPANMPAALGAALSGNQSAPQASATPMQSSPLQLPGRTPQQSLVLSAMAPQAYNQALGAALSPTDATRMAIAAGQDPATANAQALDKANSIAIRAGGGVMRGNQIFTMPTAAPAGYQNVQDPATQQWSTQPVAGGPQAVAAASQAQASGPASFKLQQVWNPVTKQFEYEPSTNIAAAANGAPPNATAAPVTGATPAPIRNNNPGALMPGGRMAQYPDMQTGLVALDNNLQSYGKQGINTIQGVISKWAPPTDAQGNAINNTTAYIQDVSKRLGISPTQPIDLTNPLTRQALSTAIALHENGPQAVFAAPATSGATATMPNGPMAAQPPLGAVSNANASQEAPAESMQKDYEGLQQVRSAAPAVLDSLDKMIALAKTKSPVMAGPLGTSELATAVSPSAAEYEKQRANVITSMAGAGSTDAARALYAESVPDYGKPQSAMLDGLQTQRNQIVAKQLKAQILTPAYNAGDSKTYTTLSNGFDQNISPSMVPLLTMPPGPQRAQALQQAIKANPQIKSKLDWAVQNGVLQ